MAVAYDVNVRLEMPQRPKWRLKHTVKFGKGANPSEESSISEQTSEEELPEEEAFKAEVENTCPTRDALGCGLATTQEELWKCWHARATEACEIMKRAGLAHIVTKPEREKGSAPEQQPRPASKPNYDEPVKVRRLRRMHRAAAEAARSGRGEEKELSVKQKTMWASAL